MEINKKATINIGSLHVNQLKEMIKQFNEAVLDVSVIVNNVIISPEDVITTYELNKMEEKC